ncbi:hypothetical protein CGMCC3_g12278 [Colletotrichum fructicola]|nr:uncharacterized protein CGMCC3_g12278 [Colletotrichum fructicola]KAE9571647.1 hypothetical protein CGMCC3_g12278 [Colletotrichum fructicola]
MKVFAYLLFLVAATATTAAPFEASPENVSLAPRNELFARKVCVVEDGMSCYYEGGDCYYHDCWDCKCDATWRGKKLTRRNCTDSTSCPTRS